MFEEKLFITCDVRDIDILVQEVFGFSYDVNDGEETGSSQGQSILEIRVFKGEHDKWWAERLETFKKTGEGQFILRTLLRELCNSGHIKEGPYLIDTSW